jgi:hypothetical protein
MVAALTVRVYTGTNAGTESSAVTGVDLISADNATNSLANRVANPVGVGTVSYEKWLKLKVDTKPDNQVSNFLVWGDGTVQTSTTLVVRGDYITGTTPIATTSSVATTSWTTYTAGNKLTWDAATYTNTNATTDYLVFQLQVAATASPGNWTQEVANYSYDEV